MSYNSKSLEALPESKRKSCHCLISLISRDQDLCFSLEVDYSVDYGPSSHCVTNYLCEGEVNECQVHLSFGSQNNIFKVWPKPWVTICKDGIKASAKILLAVLQPTLPTVWHRAWLVPTQSHQLSYISKGLRNLGLGASLKPLPLSVGSKVYLMSFLQAILFACSLSSAKGRTQVYAVQPLLLLRDICIVVYSAQPQMLHWNSTSE